MNMDKTPKERVLAICTELGEDMESPNCQRLREYVKSCPHCEAFVDSVKKTIKLYREYKPAYTNDIHKRLINVLQLD